MEHYTYDGCSATLKVSIFYLWVDWQQCRYLIVMHLSSSALSSSRMMWPVSSFGENLRAAMRVQNIDRDGLARAMEVGATQVDKWLSSNANPRLDTLFKLAAALSVSIESLCDGVNPAYEAARRRVSGAERLAEMWSRIADPGVRRSLWYILQRHAGVDQPDQDDAGPTVRAGSPDTLPDRTLAKSEP